MKAIRRNLVRRFSMQAGQARLPHVPRHCGQARLPHVPRHCGQAAILIIFVLGMVTLLIGMSLSRTGFWESVMGRGTAGTTKAFYIANSGIEDALVKVKTLTNDEYPHTHELDVDRGQAVYVMENWGESVDPEDESVVTTKVKITSTGKYENFVRRLEVIAENTTIQPDFARFIQAGDGGIEIGQNVVITSSSETEKVGIYSGNFVRGRNNGTASGCGGTATTNIDGDVFAYGTIEKLSNGDGPCISGNAYAGYLKECRVVGYGYSDSGSSVGCPYAECDSGSDPACKRPDKDELPDVGTVHIEKYLEKLVENEEGIEWPGDCNIGGVDDCSILNEDGSRTIGNMIIVGNLETDSNSILKLSGHVWVQGDVTLDSNQDIEIDDFYQSDSSLILLADGIINASANTHFYAKESVFLLMASKYPAELPPDTENICTNSEKAIVIEPNVQSILFYAMNGCALVRETASQAFLGAVLAQGVIIENNVKMIYNPALKDAKFYLGGEGGWEISSFTEI